TLIIVLMRSGEPIALSINNAFLLAMFIYTNSPNNVKLYYSTIVLVNLVINSSKIVVNFMQAIYKLYTTIYIIVVTSIV
ncbi:hypothetical protein P154DRAFT_421671, partial [Amniculicola lignicola CBS 123094]